MKRWFKPLLILASLLTASAAQAACTVTATAIGFGNYDVFLAAPANATGTITVTCTNRVTETISIGTSATSGMFNPRQMRRLTGTDRLNYNLFIDPAMLTIWGDGTLGTSTVSRRVRRNTPWVSTVYARIPAGQDVSVGAYSDTLTVTVLP